MTSFQILLCVGVVFTFISAMISFYLDKISPRILVRKSKPLSILTTEQFPQLLNENYILVFSDLDYNFGRLFSSIEFPNAVSCDRDCIYLVFKQ